MGFFCFSSTEYATLEPSEVMIGDDTWISPEVRAVSCPLSRSFIQISRLPDLLERNTIFLPSAEADGLVSGAALRVSCCNSPVSGRRRSAVPFGWIGRLQTLLREERLEKARRVSWPEGSKAREGSASRPLPNVRRCGSLDAF